eukprot:COSAG06_NODE_6019_length_3147_cov_8.060328_4_plen_185_part_01
MKVASHRFFIRCITCIAMPMFSSAWCSLSRDDSNCRRCPSRSLSTAPPAQRTHGRTALVSRRETPVEKRRARVQWVALAKPEGGGASTYPRAPCRRVCAASRRAARWSWRAGCPSRSLCAASTCGDAVTRGLVYARAGGDQGGEKRTPVRLGLRGRRHAPRVRLGVHALAGAGGAPRAAEQRVPA